MFFQVLKKISQLAGLWQPLGHLKQQQGARFFEFETNLVVASDKLIDLNREIVIKLI